MYYNIEEKRTAIRLYHEVRSVKKVVELLGYPSAYMLYIWLKQENQLMDVNAVERESCFEADRQKELYSKLYTKAILNACLIEAARLAPDIMTAPEHSMSREQFSYLSQKQKNVIVNALKKRYPEDIIKNTLDPSIENIAVPSSMLEGSLQDIYLQQKKDDMVMAAIVEAVKVAPERITLGRPRTGYNTPLGSICSFRNRYKADIVFALKDRFAISDVLQLIKLNPSSYGYYRRLRNNGRMDDKA